MELRTITLDLGNLSIQCDELGKGDRCTVLLHGLTGHRKDFEHVLPALAAHGRVLAPDLRGHGDSSHSGSSLGYDFATLIDDTCRLLDVLELESCDLIGHSFGGMVALRFALEHPDRVASLMLMSTSCEAPDLLTREVFIKAGGFAEGKGMVALQARLEELGRADESPLGSDATRDQHDWRGRYWAHHKLRMCAMDPCAYGALGLAMMDQSSLRDRLCQVQCPTTVIIGSEDAEFIRGATELAAGLEDVVRHVLEGVGHHPQQESRDAFLAIVAEHLSRANGGVPCRPSPPTVP